MTNPVTPNIGLNKIDRTSPSTTYFDLEKYIDQNADAVDQFAGETKQSLDSFASRLDTEERREVVLQPGMQVVHAERTSSFSLSGIKGRTLVNLLGRDGRLDHLSKLIQYNLTAVADQDGAKITLEENMGALAIRPVRYERGKKYILLAEAKNGTISGEIIMQSIDSEGEITPLMTSIDSTQFRTVATKYAPMHDSEGSAEAVFIGKSGQYAWVKNFRVYEISSLEYDNLDQMTPEEIALKYPYIDGMQSVSNPYVIRYGENLLPPFYEWSSRYPVNVIEPYKVGSDAISAQVIYADIKVVPEQSYTLSFDSVKCKHIAIHDISGKTASEQVYLVKTPRKESDDSPFNVTFIAPQTGMIRIHIYAYDLEAEIIGEDRNALEACSIAALNPMLSLGYEKPFKPSEDSMLAFQAELHSRPDDQSDPDVLYMRDGQYYKLTKWKHLILSGNYTYYLSAIQPGWKQLYLTLPSSGVINSETVIKFDGKKLQSAQAMNGVDQSGIDSRNNTRLYIIISNADSGWGDNYEPELGDIKAYFMGWKMYQGGQGNVSIPYNGTGSRAWVPLDAIFTNDGTPSGSTYLSTLPTQPITSISYTRYGVWEPYQLIYRLVTPIVETVVSEGCLRLSEGYNQIEVGTGMVLRERANPRQHANTNWVINNTGVGSMLSFKASAIKEIYRSNRKDFKWIKEAVSGAWGTEQAYISDANYDPSAAYSVTYFKFGKSPIQPIIGTLAANEKAQFSNLTAGVAEALQRVSVVEESKKNKGVLPVFKWLYPTLLNGWVLSSGGQFPAQYCKDENGIVHINGIVNGGAHESVIFILPPGYRPKTTHRISVVINSGTVYNFAFLNISPSGNITAFFPGSVMHLPLHCSFPAEQ